MAEPTISADIKHRAIEAWEAAKRARLSSTLPAWQSDPWRPIAVAIAAAEKRGEDRCLKPTPELAGTVPLVLYFPTRADADEFVELVREAKPGLVSRRLP